MDAVEFLVKLNEQISGPAAGATNALAVLESQIKRESSALVGLERSLANATLKLQAAEAAGDFMARDKAVAEIEKLSGAIDRQKTSLTGLAGAAAPLKGRIAELSPPLEAVAEDAGGAGGAAGLLGDKLAAMGGPVGIATAALSAVAAALGAAFEATTAFAFESANAHRSQVLLYEGLLGSAEAANDLDEAIGAMASNVPVTESRLEELATGLARAGLAGEDLTLSLGTLAAAEAAAGSEAASALEAVVKKSQALGHFEVSAKQLAQAGLQLPALYQALADKTGIGIDQVEAAMKRGEISVSDGLAAMDAAVQQRFGSVLQGKMLDASFQFAKFKEDLGNIFEGIDPTPLLEGLHGVLNVFDANTASGRALAAVAKTIFEGLFDAASAVLPYVQAALNELIIAGLKLWIQLKPLGAVLEDAFGTTPDGGLDAFVTVLGFGLDMLVGVATGAAYAVGLLAAGVAYAAQPFIALGEAVSAAYDYLASLDFGSIGTAIIDGLVNGISGGAGLVIQAVQNLGASAMSTLKATLGIASPSKVFESFGGFTAEGFAEGVEAGAPDVGRAVGSMVGMPKVDGTAIGRDVGAALGPANGNAGGIVVNITLNGVKNGQDALDRIPIAVAQALQQAYGATG